ncbi:restriction endonuclease subunit S [Candidatus Poriferisodalis sp.]|uniref:restriction endonuclease subunit S n=1 Tax=Candidatus Poriferisodalis sp. TaxID=3101277 RepID=UPI003D151E43
MVKNQAIDLDPEHLAAVSALLARFVPGYEVRAYGSRVKWTTGLNSDLDLVVIGDEHMNPLQLLELREAFEESYLPFSVDVLEWYSIAENFREEISRDHVVLQPCVHNDEWRDTTLGKFAPFVYGRSLPARSRVAEGTVKVYGSNGVVGSHDTPLTGGPTVIVGRKGTVGAVHYSPEPCWPIDTTFYVQEDDPDLARFKYHALSALGLGEMNSDSAVPGLNRGAAHAREMRVPDEASQRRIGSVLGALDEKIELNRQMCETLEEMARTLFTAWFVDFEPVRAKVEGRWCEGESLPGLPAHLHPLFPDHLVDSELGQIPAGWQVRRLGELADSIRGLSYRSTDLRESDTALVSLKSFKRGGGYRFDGLKPYVGQYKPQQVVNPGEVIIACTDVTQDAEVIGRPAVVPPTKSARTLVASLDVVILRPRDGADVPNAYLHQLACTHSFTEYLLSHTSGSTVLHLDKKCIGEYELAVPPNPVMQVCGSQLTLVVQRVLDTSAEIGSLSSTRDTLLPQLVSGALRLT